MLSTCTWSMKGIVGGWDTFHIGLGPKMETHQGQRRPTRKPESILWMLNMWRTSLPTNLTSPPPDYMAFQRSQKKLETCLHFCDIEKHIYVAVMRILWNLIRFIETKTRSKILHNTSQKNTRINFNVWDTCRFKVNSMLLLLALTITAVTLRDHKISIPVRNT